jgi:alkylated DNA repair dioxygenase AlkB
VLQISRSSRKTLHEPPTWTVRDLGEGAILHWCPNYLNSVEAQALFDHLMSLAPWVHSEVQMYGKTVPTPRLQSWMATPGTQASLYQNAAKNGPIPWTRPILKIKHDLERRLGNRCRFNYVLLNLYRDGKDSITWHADNEASGFSEHNGQKNIVASLSLGQARRFLMRHKTKHRTGEVQPIEYLLTSGSVLVMDGTTQTHWLHSVPKDPKITQPRINLTFRISSSYP